MKTSTSLLSPLSPTRWQPDAFVWWRSLVLLVALGAAFIVAQLLALEFERAMHAHIDPQHLVIDWNLLGLQVAVYLPIVPALLTGLRWTAQCSLREVGLRVPTREEAFVGFAGGLLAYAVSVAVSIVQVGLTHVKPEQQVVAALSGAHDPLVIAAFTVFACVAAPFVEETVFRGFVFNAILRYAPLWVAAVLSGLLFSLAHNPGSALLPLWAVGVILAFVYHRTGALTASMIAHGTFNATNVLLIVFAHQTS